jgi:tRNA(Ile)-lysidine synthase
MRMPVQNLLALDTEMQSLVLRQWLRRQEIPVLPESRLVEFLQQLAASQEDSQAEVQWGDWMMKRYRNDIWLHRREPFAACIQKAWGEGMQVELGPDSGSYCLRGKKTEIPCGWRVGTRKAGDRIRAFETGPSRKLKHFFQSASIPPWLRLGIPVLYWDDEPVALGDWAIGYRLQWWLMENGLELEWKPADHVLVRVRRDCQA